MARPSLLSPRTVPGRMLRRRVTLDSRRTGAAQ